MPSARAATPSGLSRFASSCQHRIAIAAMIASGMEARRAAAENTDAVHDSPTAATSGGDAQP
jgi:hypothetical protein